MAAIPDRARSQEAQGEGGYQLLHQHAGLIRPPGGRRSRGRRISVRDGPAAASGGSGWRGRCPWSGRPPSRCRARRRWPRSGDGTNKVEQVILRHGDASFSSTWPSRRRMRRRSASVGDVPRCGATSRRQDGLGEHVHGSCDHEAEDGKRDHRLDCHGDLGPGHQWHGVGWAERKRVGEAQVQVVDEPGPPAGRRQVGVQLLRERQVRVARRAPAFCEFVWLVT